MKRLKRLFQEKIILSFVMFLLLCVVLFSATTAWYSANNTAVMSGMEIGAGGIGGLKVAIEPGGPDIMMLPEVNEDGIPVIPVKLTDLNNVKEQMIAPGSYGPMTFYITSLGEIFQRIGKLSPSSLSVFRRYGFHFRIYADMFFHQLFYFFFLFRRQFVTGLLLFPVRQPHFYGISRYRLPKGSNIKRHGAIGAWRDRTAATGELVFNTEIKAEIYWVWNYEYSDIPGNENLPEEELQEKIREYDEEDTMLGNYIDHIWFDVYITGQTAEEE